MTEKARRFDRQVALITGGAGGLGGLCAKSMARDGARVAVVDITDGEAIAAEVRASGAEAEFFRCDLTDPSQVQTTVDGVLQRFGRIDILINSAGGGAIPPSSTKNLIDLPQWQALMDSNLTSTMLCCNAVAPHMMRQQAGKIVNMSSRAARGTGWFAAVSTGYVCSKIAVIGLTRDLAVKLGPYEINVNCVLPAFVASGPKMQKRWEEITPEEKERMIAATPLRRMPRPEEIASVILFLASSDASYVTGVALDVNGGSFML